MKRVKAGFLLILTVFCCSGCGTETEIPQLLTPVNFGDNWAKVQYEEYSKLFFQTGYVAMGEETMLAPATGRIQEICVKPGDQVKKGDTLVKFYVETIEENLDRLKQELEEKKEVHALLNRTDEIESQLRPLKQQELEDPFERELQRIEAEEKDMFSRQAKERREMEIRELTGKIKDLTEKKEKTVLTAPYDGEITWVYDSVIIGQTVFEGAPILIISDPNRKYVQVLSIHELKEVNDGNEVYFTPIVSIPRHELKGGTIYCQTGNRQYDLNISEKNSGSDVQYFDFIGEEQPEEGTGVIIFAKNSQPEQILTVPQEAIVSNGDKCFVYRMEGKEKVLTEIETGRRTNKHTVEVLKGLQEGEVVWIKSSNTLLSQENNSNLHTEQVQREELLDVIRMSGNNTYLNLAMVTSEEQESYLAGYTNLNNVYKEEVKKGETVAVLGFRQKSEAELKRRELAYKAALQQLETVDQQYERRIQQWQLQSQEGQPDAALEKEKLEIERKLYRIDMQKTVDQLKENWKDYQKLFAGVEIKAPCDGITDGRGFIEVGKDLSQGENLFYIASHEFYGKISDSTEKESGRKLFTAYCYPAAKVKISYGEYELQGHALSCEVTEGQGRLTRKVLVKYDEQDLGVIHKIPTFMVERLRVENMLMISQAALQQENGSTYVYVLEEGNIYRQYVLCGIKSNGKVCILEGLEKGQTIVIP